MNASRAAATQKKLETRRSESDAAGFPANENAHHS